MSVIQINRITIDIADMNLATLTEERLGNTTPDTRRARGYHYYLFWSQSRKNTGHAPAPPHAWGFAILKDRHIDTATRAGQTPILPL